MTTGILRVLALLGLLSSWVAVSAEKKGALSEDGRVDLAQWDFSKASLNLTGKWNFHWNRLDTEEELRSGAIVNAPPTAAVEPGIPWIEALADPSAEFGYASYVLKLDGLTSDAHEFGVLFHQFMLNYRAYYYNSETKALVLLAAAGTVGKSKDATGYQMIRQLAALPALTPHSSYLIIQTSRYLLPGLIESAPEIGSYSRLKAKEDRAAWEAFWILGTFFCLFCINLLLFLLRPEYKPNLFLTLFSILVIARYMSTEAIYSRLFPEPNQFVFNLSIFIVGTAFPLGLATYLQFFSLALPNSYPRWALRLSWIISIVLSTTLFAVKANPNYVGMVFYLLATLIVPLLTLLKSIRDLVVKKERNVGILLLGFSILALALMNDFFVYMRLYTFPFVGHYGMMFFVFTQLIVVSRNFAVAFRTAEKLSSRLQDEVERQTRDVKAILNSVNLGILSVIQDMTVGDDYSAHLKEILGTDDIQGRSFMELIFSATNLSDEKRSIIRSVLSGSLGEDLVSFEMNSDNLEHEFIYMDPSGKRKVLTAFWDPVINEKNGRIEKILLILRDITLLREMQELTIMHQRDTGITAELVKVTPKALTKFLSSSKRYIEDIRMLMRGSQVPDPGLYKNIFINLHTIKGAARTLGFTLIADAAHGAEDRLAQIQKDREDPGQLEFDIQTLVDVISQYERVSIDKLKWLESEETLQLKQAEVEGLMNCVKALEAAYPVMMQNRAFLGIRKFAAELVYEDLKQTILEVAKTLPGLARDLQKPEPQITVDSPAVGISKSIAAAIGDALIHILRNIMDHGLETRDARLQKGKAPQGMIRFKCSREPAGNFHVMVADDGCGLQVERIREIAIKKGLIKEQDALSLNEITSLIFLPGFSTSTSVNQVSGRGVGMGAVKELIEKFGGTVRLVTESYEPGPIPFRLLIDIPPRHTMDLNPA